MWKTETVQSHCAAKQRRNHIARRFEGEKSGFSPNTEGEADAFISEFLGLNLLITEMLDSTDNEPRSITFQATVIEINNDTILVKPVDNGILSRTIRRMDGEDDTIEIYMNEKWFIFEYREEKVFGVQKGLPTVPMIVNSKLVKEHMIIIQNVEHSMTI